MKYSSKLSDAVHLLAFIDIQRQEADTLPTDIPLALTSKAIAFSLHTNPSFVRQIMMKLKNADLLISEQGTANPYLGKPAEDITLLDIYKAVEGDKPLLHLDKNINQECTVGVNIQMILQDYYNQVQQTAEAKLQTITLAMIIADYYKRVPAHTLPI